MKSDPVKAGRDSLKRGTPMSLSAGTRLGLYEVTALLGQSRGNNHQNR